MKKRAKKIIISIKSNNFWQQLNSRAKLKGSRKARPTGKQNPRNLHQQHPKEPERNKK